MTAEPESPGRWKMRAIGGGPFPDYVVECDTCGALVTYDDAAMRRHLAWHEQVETR